MKPCIDKRPAKPSKRVRRYAPVIVVAITIGLVGCSVLTTPKSLPHHGIGPRVAYLAPTNWTQPLVGAHRMTLAMAAHMVGFAIPLPNMRKSIHAGSWPAGQIRLRLSQVWVNSARVVALVFNRGKVTMLVERATSDSPLEVFRRDLAAIHVGRVAIRRVNGRPAFIAWPRTDYTRSNPALVEFYLNGLDIHVISTRLNPNLLLAIASQVTH